MTQLQAYLSRPGPATHPSGVSLMISRLNRVEGYEVDWSAFDEWASRREEGVIGVEMMRDEEVLRNVEVLSPRKRLWVLKLLSEREIAYHSEIVFPSPADMIACWAIPDLHVNRLVALEVCVTFMYSH